MYSTIVADFTSYDKQADNVIKIASTVTSQKASFASIASFL
jgi:hypothetical protein